MPLYIAFIDLTKAFDLISTKSLFQLLKKIDCPPQLHSVTASFHGNMKGTISYDGGASEPFLMQSEVEEGCILAQIQFGIFFSLLISLSPRMESTCTPEAMGSYLT